MFPNRRNSVGSCRAERIVGGGIVTRINSSTATLLALNQYRRTADLLSQSLVRMSTGLRIHSGADDPAGLIAGEELTSRITEIDAELQIHSRVGSALTVADSGLSQVSGLLTSLKGYALAAANTAVMSPAAQQVFQSMIDGTVESIDRIARTTSLSGRALLDGTFTAQCGGSSLTIASAASSALGQGTDESETGSLASICSGGANSLAQGGAAEAAEIIDRAISEVSQSRGAIGAFRKNTLDVETATLEDELVVVSGARSAILDTDYAAEAAQLTRLLILAQSGASSLAIVNRRPETVLALLDSWQT